MVRTYRLIIVAAFGLSVHANLFGEESTATKADTAKLHIHNGGMTQGLNVPAEWNGKYGDCEIVRDTETFKEGPASLRIDVKGKSGQAFQSFSAKGIGKFTIEGWVKSKGSVKVNVAVQAFDEKVTKNDFQQVKYVQADTDWTEFHKEITLPDWATQFHILILADGEGSAWLDEVHEASAKVDPGIAVDPLTTESAPQGKPWEPGWGFYPTYPQGWQLHHKSLLEKTKAGNIEIMFFGDSITQGWTDNGKEAWEKHLAPLKAADYGIGGDSTRQILWRLDHGEVAGLNPKLVVLMIGTNNLYGDHNAGSDEEIAKGIAATVHKTHEKLPESKVLVIGILPRQNDYFCTRIEAINAITRKLDNGNSVRYVDLKEKFETALGKVKPELYVADQLHLSPKGYEVLEEGIWPIIDQMLMK